MKKSFQIQIIQRIISALNNFKEKISERELKKHEVTISRLTSLKRLPLALMEGKIQLFCYIFLGLVTFCKWENLMIQTGTLAKNSFPLVRLDGHLS
ncbi:hypothetical protein IFM89_006858 [Coptis chinensis]|uniref:Uncharacterized protein n=1 Tax=Coptis chinensis TaxID=261450 RepID=A0A835LDN7_9MAGN|nr:hypothetical protein IFM89_006858 [Coptis chinensis]